VLNSADLSIAFRLLCIVEIGLEWQRSLSHILSAFHACPATAFPHLLSPDSQFRSYSRLSLSYEKRTNIIDGVEIARSYMRGVVGRDDWWLVVVRAGWGLFRSPAAERYWETFHGLMVCRGHHNFGRAFDNQQVN
jgi:hypothetical protein